MDWDLQITEVHRQYSFFFCYSHPTHNNSPLGFSPVLANWHGLTNCPPPFPPTPLVKKRLSIFSVLADCLTNKGSIYYRQFATDAKPDSQSVIAKFPFYLFPNQLSSHSRNFFSKVVFLLQVFTALILISNPMDTISSCVRGLLSFFLQFDFPLTFCFLVCTSTYHMCVYVSWSQNKHVDLCQISLRE